MKRYCVNAGCAVRLRGAETLLPDGQCAACTAKANGQSPAYKAKHMTFDVKVKFVNDNDYVSDEDFEKYRKKLMKRLARDASKGQG